MIPWTEFAIVQKSVYFCAKPVVHEKFYSLTYVKTEHDISDRLI